VSLYSLSIVVQIIYTTNELVDRIRYLKVNASQNDASPSGSEKYLDDDDCFDYFKKLSSKILVFKDRILVIRSLKGRPIVPFMSH